MATASPSALDPLDQAYFGQQRINANDSYAIGKADNASAQTAADDSYDQKIAALDQNIAQERAQLPDKFAARGLLNSGIYFDNNPGIGTPGAWQQFGINSTNAKGDLALQKLDTNNQYAQKMGDLGKAHTDTLNTINTTSAADHVGQVATDAIGAF